MTRTNDGIISVFTSDNRAKLLIFFLLAVLSAGIIIGFAFSDIFVYDYQIRYEKEYFICNGSLSVMLLDYLDCLFNAVMPLLAVFICGFTVFSDIAGACILFSQGFAFGLSLSYLSSSSDFISQNTDPILCGAVFTVYSVCMLAAALIVSIRSSAFSRTLKSAVPSASVLIKSRGTHMYFLSFLTVCGAVICLLAFRFAFLYIFGTI